MREGAQQAQRQLARPAKKAPAPVEQEEEESSSSDEDEASAGARRGEAMLVGARLDTAAHTTMHPFCWPGK